jgi:outer membrane lipoprotein SlyB
MNKLINLTAIGLVLCLGGEALATEPYATNIQDHYKTVIKKIPETVEICSKGNGKTDFENFITGGIIGGAIGNNLPGEKGGGAIGAIIGGALNAERNKGMTCRTETHYKKNMETIYSHSTIKFNYNGRSYSVSFKK